MDTDSAARQYWDLVRACLTPPVAGHCRRWQCSPAGVVIVCVVDPGYVPRVLLRGPVLRPVTSGRHRSSVTVSSVVGGFSSMQLTLDLTTDSSGAVAEEVAAPALDRLSSQAAASLAEIIRAYRATHLLGRTGEPDLGDWLQLHRRRPRSRSPIDPRENHLSQRLVPCCSPQQANSRLGRR